MRKELWYVCTEERGEIISGYKSCFKVKKNSKNEKETSTNSKLFRTSCVHNLYFLKVTANGFEFFISCKVYVLQEVLCYNWNA